MRPSRARLLVLAFAAAAAAWLYRPALDFAFVNWDDDKLLLANPWFRGLAWTHLRWMLTTFHTGPYQPLSWLSYALDHALWGMAPRGYHLTNLVLHAANAALAAAVARELIRRALPGEAARLPGAAEAAAGLAALLFALHPLRAEAVAWVTQRRELLAGFFALWTVLLHLRGRAGLSALAYALSLAAKGSAVSLPLVLLVLDAYPLKRRLEARLLAEKLPHLALAAAALALGVLGQSLQGAVELDPASPALRLMQVLFASGFYLGKTLWPSGLLPLYELPDYADPWAGRFLFSAAGVAGLSWACWRLRRRAPGLAAAWLCHLLGLLPVLGIVRFGPAIVADRYSYVPCLAWAVLAGGAWLSLWARARGTGRAGLGAAAAAVVLGLAWAARAQALTWRDSESLWTHALAVDPGHAAAHNNLGTVLLERGRPEEAASHFRAALERRPAYADGHNNLAVALAGLGRLPEAADSFARSAELRPHPAVLMNLARVLDALGRPAEARARRAEAARLSGL